MNKEYFETRKEIVRIAEMYHRSQIKEAQESYCQYMRLVITNAELSPLEKEILFDLWEDVK